MRIKINKTAKLYIIPCGKGYTTHGFEVVDKLARKLATELGDTTPPARRGTLRRYRQYQSLCDTGRARNAATGWRSSAALTPELAGYEGRRVEVRHQWPSGSEEVTRFLVGKSTGWMPCHLQLHNRRSSGGGAVCLGKILSVREV